MEDLVRKVAFLEARLTLLERRLAHSSPHAPAPEPADGGAAPAPTRLACNSPGLMISRMYSAEWSEDGEEFCWIGNEGPLQFVLPVRPTRAMQCRLHLQPHPKVDFSAVSVLVNDEERERKIRQEKRGIGIEFDVPPSPSPNVNILLLGVDSVRPSDYGENSDNRLLAARFFGADVAF